MPKPIFAVNSTTLTSTGTAVFKAVPFDATSGKLPTRVSVKATGQGAYVRLSNDNTVATNADVLVQGGDHVVLSVNGRRVVSALSDGASSTVSVTALPDVSGDALVSPTTLFAAGEQGAWYDPSDLTTLFQDSAGTTPVTAVEQPVGLVLDKSKGLALGSELVTNGDFATDTAGWTLAAGGTATVSGGVVTLTNVASRARLSQFDTTVVGRSYKVVVSGVNLGNSPAGSVRLLLGATQFILASGTNSLLYAATGTSTEVALFENDTTAGLFFSVDSISVKEIAGNHAFQTTSASRPTLRARYNLLTYSEQFDNAYWLKTNVTVTANATTAPDGSLTADKLVTGAITGQQRVESNGVSLSATTYGFSVYAKAAGFSYMRLETGASIEIANFDLALGVVGTASGAATITPAGNGWYRCFMPVNASAGSSGFRIYVTDSSSSGRGSGITGNGVDGIFIWGAQLTQTTVFPSNTYQRIATATDYATAGFPPYLFFDGVDDSLLTNSVNFSATDKMTVWTGVTKSSDAAAGVLTELSALFGNNNGSFTIYAPDSAAAQYYFGLQGTTVGRYIPTGFAAPITNVLSVGYNIGAATLATEITPRINGVLNQANPSASDAGTGNFGNYPLYIGRRNNATVPLNGNIYSLIIRGAQSTAAQVSSTETWVAAKTPLGTI